MAIQTLTSPSRSALFGKTLSTGLSNLAQAKMQQLQQTNQLKALQGLSTPGISQEQRGQLAGFLSPEMQQEYFKQELKRPGEEAYAQALFGQEGQGAHEGQRFNEKQATELAKIQREQSKEEYEKAKPFIKNIREDAPIAKNILNSLDKMQKALDSGKVQLGYLASKAPTAFLNEETQNFITAANDIVTQESDATKGRPTDFKTRLIQGKKPSIEYKQEVNQELIDGLRKKALKQVNLEKAYDDVSLKYGAKTPANIEQLIKISAKKISKNGPIKLPPISEYDNNDIIQDKNGGYHRADKQLGEWVDVDESEVK